MINKPCWVEQCSFCYVEYAYSIQKTKIPNNIRTLTTNTKHNKQWPQYHEHMPNQLIFTPIFESWKKKEKKNNKFYLTFHGIILFASFFFFLSFYLSVSLHTFLFFSFLVSTFHSIDFEKIGASNAINNTDISCGLNVLWKMAQRSSPSATLATIISDSALNTFANAVLPFCQFGWWWKVLNRNMRVTDCWSLIADCNKTVCNFYWTMFSTMKWHIPYTKN